MRTAADVRSHFLTHWRELVPEIIVTGVRVSGSRDDVDVIEIELLVQPGAPVQRLLLTPGASSEPRQVRGMLPRLRRLATLD